MSDNKPDRKLLLKIAENFHSGTYEQEELETHWALFEKLFMEIGNRYDDLFRVFGVNLFHITGQWCSLSTHFFLPSLYARSSFFSDERIAKVMQDFFNLKLKPYSDLGVEPLDEKQILRLTVQLSNIGERNVLMGKPGSELLFFMTNIARMRRIIDVMRAARSKGGGDIAYLGTNPEEFTGLEGLDRCNNYGEICKRHIAERNHYIERFVENWSQVRDDMTDVIHTIIAKYSDELYQTSTDMLLGHFLKEFLRCVMFAPIAKAALEEYKPEGVVVNCTAAPWENVLAHMAKAEGITSYEIIDAASSDHPLKHIYADPETTAADYLIGGKGMEKWLKKRGFPDERLVFLGAPHYDDIPPRSRSREEIESANSRDGFDLLMIVQPQIQYFNINNYIIASEVIRACRGTNIRVHIKMKYTSNRMLMRQLGEEMHSENVIISPSDLYITQLLDKQHFDGVVSASSNGMMEAVTMGVPVLWVSDAFKRLQFLVDYWSLGVPTKLRTLGKDLLRFTDNAKLRWKSLQKAVDYVDKEGIFNNRGKCSNLVAEFLLDKRKRKTGNATLPPPRKKMGTKISKAAFTNFIEYYSSAGVRGDKELFEESVNRYAIELLSDTDEAMRSCSGYYMDLARILHSSYSYLGREGLALHIFKRLRAAMPLERIHDGVISSLADLYIKLDQPDEAIQILSELERRAIKYKREPAYLYYKMATVIMRNLDRLGDSTEKEQN